MQKSCSPCVVFAGVYFRVTLGMGSLIKDRNVWLVGENRENDFIQNVGCFSESIINFLVCCFSALYFHANSGPSGI